MRLSTIAVSSAFLLAGLGAAFPVEGATKLVARSADSDFTGIEVRAYEEEHASMNLPNNYSHHPRSFYEQSHSELTRRRDPPLPPYLKIDSDSYLRHMDRWDTHRQYQNLDRWDTRRQQQNQAPPRQSRPSTIPQQSQPPTIPSSPPHSPGPSHSRLTRRRDPPLSPVFPSGNWVRHLDIWDSRREHQIRQSRPSAPPSETTTPPRSPSPRHPSDFHDSD